MNNDQPVRVFISYSHDSPEHREKVLALSERLREDGIETLLDQYMNGCPQEGWPRWMLNQLDNANFVLVVCTETYYRRFRGHEKPDKGKGADWEGALITQEIYDSRSQTLKFVPIFMSEAFEDWIPEPLRSRSYYALTNEVSYDNLYDFILQQSGVEPGKVGVLKKKTRRKGKPLTFEESYPSLERKFDISRIIKYAPAVLIGREDETKLLNNAWAKVQNQEKGRPHLMTFVALGGEGKTALVAKWAAVLAVRDWAGCDCAFAWSFYSQGVGEKVAADSDLFLKTSLDYFGDEEDKAFAASNAGAYEKGQRLARIIGKGRNLLILDGLEPLQYPPTSPTPGELKDQGIVALLKGLAQNSLGLCIVTTRYSITDLKAFWQTTSPKVELLRLSKEAGVHLLQKLGVRKQSGTKEEFEKLVEDVKGHALTLTLLGSYLTEFHAGDIRKRDLVKLEKADEEIEVLQKHPHHTFNVMDAYVKQLQGQRAGQMLALLHLLGLFDRPATADCLGALWIKPAISGLTETLVDLDEGNRNSTLKRLETAKLLTVNRDASGTLVSLDAHPHIREYFAKQLREKNPDAWRAAHKRLYEHLCASTKEGDQPTLEDLQPLYQAVAHGCQAGLQEEAWGKLYVARILRGSQHYSWKKLGVFGMDIGAASCFFNSPWNHVSSSLKPSSAAFVCNQTALYLRALSRLSEALEPMRAATDWAASEKDWGHAAVGASNLSELELTLGDVGGSLWDAEQSITYADRSGYAFQRMARRAHLADALHQAGRQLEALERFREAEQMQQERQPNHLLLYSAGSFNYCDLLMADTEKAAWQQTQRLMVSGKCSELIKQCRDVSQRVAETLKIAERNNWLLDIACDHLTLGRTALYEAILSKSEIRNSKSEIEEAVSGLRRAGTMHHIPRGLLTRAWFRFLTNDLDGAMADLDEAWEIAERGPMKLFMADIHLYRARLFGRKKAKGKRQKKEIPYPWESPEADLKAAEKIIRSETNYKRPDGTLITARYARRDEELADAKKAIL